MRKRTLTVLLVAGVALMAFTLRKNEPAVLWVKDLSANWALAPAIGPDGTIYFADETNNLCAVARDGSVLWKTLLGSTSPTSFTAPTAISIDPSQTVYVVWGNGKVVALGPGGKTRWLRDLGVFEFAGTAFGPDNTIYAGSKSNTLYAISPDGSLKWQFRTLGEKIGGPVVGRDGTVYFGCNDTNLYALNPDGRPKWICTNAARLSSRPIIGPDGIIYVDCWERFHAITGDGQIKWTITNTSLRTVYRSAILDSSNTLFVCATDGVIALEAATGKAKWKYNVKTVWSYDLALANDGTIYSGGSGIEALDVNGKRKWRFRRDFARRGVPLGVRILDRIWNLGKLRDVPVAFTLTEDNRLYAIMADSKLYALEVSSGLSTNAPWPMFKHDVRHSDRAIAR